MDSAEVALSILEDWWNALPRSRRADALPAFGNLAAALLLLDRLQEKFSLDIRDHLAAKSLQIAGLGRSAVERILSKRGVTKSLPAEAGRTNAGTLSSGQVLLLRLKDARLAGLPAARRSALLAEMQRWLIHVKLPLYGEWPRLRFRYDPRRSVKHMLSELLVDADTLRKERDVAGHLVAAHFDMRFGTDPPAQYYPPAHNRPGAVILNEADFLVTDLRSRPSFEQFENLASQDRLVYLLVPSRAEQGAQQHVMSLGLDFVTVASVESFLALGIECQARFERVETARLLRRLLDTYNTRVNTLERDKTIMIGIPARLGEAAVPHPEQGPSL